MATEDNTAPFLVIRPYLPQAIGDGFGYVGSRCSKEFVEQKSPSGFARIVVDVEWTYRNGNYTVNFFPEVTVKLDEDAELKSSDECTLPIDAVSNSD